MSKTVTIVTTFSDKNFEDYAKHCVTSLQRYAEKDIKVKVYTDTPYLWLQGDNWENLILETQVPELRAFKKRNGGRPVPPGSKGFTKDGVRFSHKSYAWCHAGLNCDTDVLMWLDADSEIIDTLTSNYLTKFVRDGYVSSYLGRKGRFTETGYLGWNMNHPDTKRMFLRMKQYYDEDLLYKMRWQTDCHVYDAVREEFEGDGARFLNLTPDLTSGHFNETFVGYITHYKGNDKNERKRHFREAMRRKREQVRSKK